MDIPRSINVPKYDLASTRQDDVDDYQDLQVKNYDLTSIDTKGQQDQDDYSIILDNLSLPSNGPVDINDISKNLYYNLDNEGNASYDFGTVDPFVEGDELNNSSTTNTTVDEGLVFNYVGEKGIGEIGGSTISNGGGNGTRNSNGGGSGAPIESNGAIVLQNGYGIGNGLISEYGLMDANALLGINMNEGNDDINFVKGLECEDRSNGNLNPIGTNTSGESLWDEEFSNNSLEDLLFNDSGGGGNGGGGFNSISIGHGIANDGGHANHKHSVSLPELYANKIFGNEEVANQYPSRSTSRFSIIEEDICKHKRHRSESGPRTASVVKKKKKNKRYQSMHYGNGYNSSSTRSSTSSTSSRSNSNSPSEGVNMTSNVYNTTEAPNTTTTSQKGDTITLRQPSFAEGREDVGSFGFINFRKPGAWTREKPHKSMEEEGSPKSNDKYKRVNLSRVYR